MLEMRSEAAQSESTQRIGGVFPATGGGNVMSLIKNEKVKFPGIDRFTLGRKNLAKQTKRALSFQEINRGDEAWKVSPGIDMQTTFASQRLHQFAINDAKLQAKLVAHLVVPLNL